MNAEFDGGWSDMGRESKDYERLPETGEAFIRIALRFVHLTAGASRRQSNGQSGD